MKMRWLEAFVVMAAISMVGCEGAGDEDGDGDGDGPDGDELDSDGDGDDPDGDGPDGDEDPAGEGLVGAACRSADDCRADLSCEDLELGGHCEKDCATDEECGEGGVCTSDEGGLGGTCYHACSSDADCRSDRACVGGVAPRLFCDPPA